MDSIENTRRVAPADAPTPSKTRKSQKKRDKIIRVAIEIINSKSYALATMSDIAAALDLRDATLYYYFPNKRALAYMCLTRTLERFERLLVKVEKQDKLGAEKVELIIKGMLEDGVKNGPLLYMGDYSYLDSTQRKKADAWVQQLTDRLEQFFKDGIKDGSVIPCETKLVVNLMLGMLIWFGKWVPSIEDITVDRMMEAIRAFTLHGLGDAG